MQKLHDHCKNMLDNCTSTNNAMWTYQTCWIRVAMNNRTSFEKGSWWCRQGNFFGTCAKFVGDYSLQFSNRFWSRQAFSLPQTLPTLLHETFTCWMISTQICSDLHSWNPGFLQCSALQQYIKILSHDPELFNLNSIKAGLDSHCKHCC